LIGIGANYYDFLDFYGANVARAVQGL